MTKLAPRRAFLDRCTLLTSDHLRRVTGGDGAPVDLAPLPETHEVVSPRDPASGLPTGKRIHHPY
jgi:hypothetical protein